MRLSHIKHVGRYEDTETGKLFNIKVGKNMQRGTDIMFYLRSGSRVYISDADFWSNKRYIKIGE